MTPARIRAAIQRCFDASPAPPTTDDIAAAVLLEAADVVVPDPRAFLSPGTAGQIREALQTLARLLNGTTYPQEKTDE